MPARVLIGLSVASGLEGVDVAVVRAAGLGLELAPRVERAARLPFPPAVRDALRATQAAPDPGRAADLARKAGDAAVQAVRHACAAHNLSAREVTAVGLLDPARPAVPVADGGGWGAVADRVAEQTGLTTLHHFRGRDAAAGGTGHPITAVADHLLFRSVTEERLLIHLGSAAGVVLVPAGGKVSGVVGFDAGPGNRLLDDLVFHGTRGKEPTDPGGRKAVQGRSREPLLAAWADHPFLTRKPPKAVHPEAFGRSFLLSAFDAARQDGAGLADLLCSATQFAARCVGAACREWLPPPAAPRGVYLSGGGVRNGLLWQLVGQQFEGQTLSRLDDAGVPALARGAAAAAVLAALTLDGVAGNLPSLTGAAGGRLLGQIVPGDARNWAKCAGWLAEQSGDHLRLSRAA